LSRIEPNIIINLSFLENTCEEVIEKTTLSGVELDINTNSSSTEKSSEDIIVEQSLSRVDLDIDINSSFIETTYEEFSGEKLDIQKIRSPHEPKKNMKT